MSAVLVYVVHHEGAFNRGSLGALGEGARVAAELGGDCAAVVVGGRDLTDDRCAGLGAHGAARVYRARAPEGLAQPVVDVMAGLAREEDARCVLFGGGLLGFEVGAGLAARLGVGVTVEVTQIRLRDGRLVAVRPALQDTAVVETGFVGEPAVVVGRLNAFEVARGRDGASAEVHDVDVELSPWSTRARMVRRGERRGAEVSIEDADVLVTGGRGLGGPEGFAVCEELAGGLGGAVAATRAAVDAGWYPYSAQIGQTGKTVAPRLYVGAGVSGAIQHKVGMQGAQHVVAVNRDRHAPIFEFADLGVVGDVDEILPRLVEAVKARRGG